MSLKHSVTIKSHLFNTFQYISLLNHNAILENTHWAPFANFGCPFWGWALCFHFKPWRWVNYYNTYLRSLCISCNDQKCLKVLHILVNLLLDESHILTPGVVGWCHGKKTVWSQVEFVSYFDSIMRFKASSFISRSVFFLQSGKRALVLLSNKNWSRNCSCYCFCHCYFDQITQELTNDFPPKGSGAFALLCSGNTDISPNKSDFIEPLNLQC